MKRLYALLLFCLAAIPAWGAAPRITGRLLEAGTSEPIAFATVLLYEPGKTDPLKHTASDQTGTFRFESVPDGLYTVMIQFLGYDVVTLPDVRLDAAAPAVNLGDLAMTPLEVGIAEVTVVGYKKQMVYKLDKKVIDASADMMGSGGSAVDILENTPSIRVNAEGEVTFRGSSGFTVYVDGKPGAFTGSQALEQIPAGQIENIEIITTPSARHDTEGDVGIINIVTKKESQRGLSGMVNVSGSTLLSRNIDFMLVQQNQRSRWHLGGIWSDRMRKSDFDQEKTTIIDGVTTVSHSKGPRVGQYYNYVLQAGWYYATPRTTVSIDAEGGYGGNKRNGNLRYGEKRYVGGTLTEEGAFRSKDDYDNDQTIGMGNVFFEHRFNERGHKLSAGLYYKYGGNALEYFFSDLFNGQGEREQGHRAWESEHRITERANLDYVWPYSPSGKLEAGYQYYSYLEDGDYKMQFWDPEGKVFYWRDDIYNTFYFQEGVNSVYTVVSQSWRGFEGQAGVRGEHTHTVLRSSIEGKNRLKNRFELFPSVHVGYTFGGSNRLLASYSRRTTRPQLYYMEPYITFRDYYTAEIGNPDIRPEYINSFELNYQKTFGENSVSATLFHRSRQDKIERLRVPYTAGVTLDSMANVGHDYSTGLELNATLRAARWWNITLNGSVYHYKVKNERAAGGKVESSTNFDIVWNNSFYVGKNTRVQLTGNFVGPSVTTQGRTDTYWYANLAVRQQLFRRKVTATLAFRDIFASARYVSDINTPDLRSLTRITPKYPQLSLTLSYTFNSFKSGATQSDSRQELFEGTNH